MNGQTSTDELENDLNELSLLFWMRTYADTGTSHQTGF